MPKKEYEMGSMKRKSAGGPPPGPGGPPGGAAAFESAKNSKRHLWICFLIVKIIYQSCFLQ